MRVDAVMRLRKPRLYVVLVGPGCLAVVNVRSGGEGSCRWLSADLAGLRRAARGIRGGGNGVQKPGILPLR